MCKDTHHPWEAMNLQHIQELKRLHFKPKAGVHQQQYLQSVCVCGCVGRGVCWEGGVLGGGVLGGGCIGRECVGRGGVWRRVEVGGGCLEEGGGGATHFLFVELQDLPGLQSWPHQSWCSNHCHTLSELVDASSLHISNTTCRTLQMSYFFTVLPLHSMVLLAHTTSNSTHLTLR